MEKQYDLVAIGDNTTDAFIRLKDAEATCDLNREHCKLCLRFGDKVPYESVEEIRAVGNSANAAVCNARLGLSSALMAVVGNDQNGKDCLETLQGNKVSTEYMTTDATLPTNYHYVLWYDVERTILIKHSPYERHLPENFKAPKWIYLSSLGSNTESFHHEIIKWLKVHPETKLAFQPGTFQIQLGTERLKDIYQLSEIFFCNVDEAQRILGIDGKGLPSGQEGKKKLMDMINLLGPKIVVITDGVDGAYAKDLDGSYYFMPIYPHDPYERTGAGDAFSSTVVAALINGKTLKEALTWAPINAMSVTLQVGAQKGLLSQDKLLEYLQKAPEDYKISKIN